MRKLLLLLFICGSVYSQNTEFVFDKDGFVPTLVLPFEGKTQSELYKKTLQWIEVTYKNPKEVLKGNIENDYVRFTGVKTNSYCVNMIGKKCYDLRYTIEIYFKDNRCKFDLIQTEFYADPSQYTSGGWFDLPLTQTENYYRKNGEIKGSAKYVPETIDQLNALKKDFESFIVDDKLQKAKSDW